MNISFRKTGKTYEGEGEVYHLYINDKKVNDAEYTDWDDGYLTSGELRADDLILRFYNAECSEFPDKLKTACYVEEKPLSRLDYGELSEIGIGRNGDIFTVKIAVVFDEDNAEEYYFNPLQLLRHAVAVANNNGMQDCISEGNDLFTYGSALFYYHSNTEGTIGLKIEEARALVNKALQTAARLLHELTGEQLFPGETKKKTKS